MILYVYDFLIDIVYQFIAKLLGIPFGIDNKPHLLGNLAQSTFGVATCSTAFLDNNLIVGHDLNREVPDNGRFFAL